LIGTPWEHDGNTLRTREENKKIPVPPLKKKKNWTVHECMLSLLPIGCMKFLFPKPFVTIFGLG
jgi:hypothetical protein